VDDFLARNMLSARHVLKNVCLLQSIALYMPKKVPYHALRCKNGTRLFWGAILLYLAGCNVLLPSDRPEIEAAAVIIEAEVDGLHVMQQPFAQPAACTTRFVAHDLAHVTTVAAEPISMFDGAGSGVAVNDLDNDGDIDIVLANLAGLNTILWNQGELRFTQETLSHGNSRGVTTVDVDADGWFDIVFTTPPGSISYWRNLAGDSAGSYFEQKTLTGVREPAYSMNWADFDADGDLDLVTGSYDAALEKMLGSSFMLSNGAGIFFYENQTRVNQNRAEQLPYFVADRLAERANALALLTTDLNVDGRIDLLAGNDFVLYDQAWYQSENGWIAAEIFVQTTHSTMSFDVGDIDNDGSAELFATDMQPYADDVNTKAAWQPMLEMMTLGTVPDDPQIMENVFQVRNVENRFENRAAAVGVDATGWSWSAKFGDLDNDGFLDIYVVNGMISNELFRHLPNSELVEENQALRNVRVRDSGSNRRFDPALTWGLNGKRSGRGMSMADFDNDGDLDIVVNNLLSAAQLFENQLCGGSSLEIDLLWPASQNRRAIGAQLFVQTDEGRYMRTVQAASGYLSGDAARIHFGFPSGTLIQQIEIRWPDGVQSIIRNIASNQLVRITR